jgi:hypothetical protein
MGGPVVALALFVFVWELPRERAAQEREAREGRLLTFGAADIDTVRFRREDGGFVLARHRDDAWRPVAPSGAVLKRIPGLDTL